MRTTKQAVIYLLGVLLFCGTAFGNGDVLFTLRDLAVSTVPLIRRTVEIQPNSTPVAEGTNIVLSERRFFNSGTNGEFTVTNMVTGDYRCLLYGPTFTNVFWISVPTFTGTSNAASFLIANGANAQRVVTTIKTNGTTVSASARSLNIISGTNMVIRGTNASGFVDLEINSAGAGGGAATNAVSTIYNGAATLLSGATGLRFVAGTNTTIRATNEGSGIAAIQINANADAISNLLHTLETTRNAAVSNSVVAYADVAASNRVAVAGGTGGITVIPSGAGGITTFTISDDDVGSGGGGTNVYTNITYVNILGSAAASWSALTNAAKRALPGTLLHVGPGTFSGELSWPLNFPGVDLWFHNTTISNLGVCPTISDTDGTDILDGRTNYVFGNVRLISTNAANISVYNPSSKLYARIHSAHLYSVVKGCVIHGDGELHLNFDDVLFSELYDSFYNDGSGPINRLTLIGPRLIAADNALEMPRGFTNRSDCIIRIGSAETYGSGGGGLVNQFITLSSNTVANIDHITMGRSALVGSYLTNNAGAAAPILHGKVIKGFASATNGITGNGSGSSIVLDGYTIYGPNNIDPLGVLGQLTIRNVTVIPGSGATNWARDLGLGGEASVVIDGTVNVRPWLPAHANITVTGSTNQTAGLVVSSALRLPSIATNALLQIGGQSNVVGLGIGSGLAISGGNLTATGGGGGASTNANQFSGDTPVLTLKSGMQATNVLLYPASLSGTPLTIKAALGQDSNLMSIKDSSDNVMFALGYDGVMFGVGANSPILQTGSTAGHLWTATDTTGIGSWVVPQVTTALLNTASNTLHSTETTRNAAVSNGVVAYVDVAASNRVVVAAGTGGITVTPSGSGGVMTFTVNDDDAGSGGGTNYPHASNLLGGTNVNLGSGVRQFLTLTTNASFTLNFQGTALNGETVRVGVSNTAAATIYVTNFAGGSVANCFDPYVASNVTTFQIASTSIRFFDFAWHSNFNLGTVRQELHWSSEKQPELAVASAGANGFLSLVTNANTIAVSNSYIPQSSSMVLSNFVGTGAITNLFSAGDTNSTKIALVQNGTNTTGGIKTLTAGANVTFTQTGQENISIAAAGSSSQVFSPTLSNLTIKPLVVGVGNAAGATNATGEIRGLEAGTNMFLFANGSNVVLNMSVPTVFHATNIANVRHYGAIGDGTTDDTLAVSNAFQKPIVYFPAGSYSIHPLAFTGRRIFGDGPVSSQIISRSISNLTTVISVTSTSAVIDNLWIRGTNNVGGIPDFNVSSAPTAVVGIKFNSGFGEGSVKNVRFSECNYGLWIIGTNSIAPRYNAGIFGDNTFTNCYAGITTGSTNEAEFVQIRDNTFIRCYRAFYNLSAANILFTGNIIRESGGSGIYAAPATGSGQIRGHSWYMNNAVIHAGGVNFQKAFNAYLVNNALEGAITLASCTNVVVGENFWEVSGSGLVLAGGQGNEIRNNRLTPASSTNMTGYAATNAFFRGNKRSIAAHPGWEDVWEQFNVISLSTSNATSKPLTNSFKGGLPTLFGLEAGTGMSTEPNASNIVISAKSSVHRNTTVTTSNLVWNVALTNTHEIIGWTNVYLTNVVGMVDLVTSDTKVFLRPSGVNMTIFYPAFASPIHGYYWRTNAKSPMWTTATNGKTYVVEMTAIGTNLFSTMTEWP